MTNKAQRKPGMANKRLRAELRFGSPFGPKAKSPRQIKGRSGFGSGRVK